MSILVNLIQLHYLINFQLYSLPNTLNIYVKLNSDSEAHSTI